jgi:hypothetical protein
MNTYRNFEYKKTYDFTFNTGDVKFGLLDFQTLKSLFGDGRTASFFMERHIPLWFPTIEFSSSKGYDFLDKSKPTNSIQHKIDQKTFTKYGVNYAESNLKGGSRVFNEQQFLEHTSTISYCITDVTNFPRVSVVFWTGEDLLKTFGRAKIAKSQRSMLFI